MAERRHIHLDAVGGVAGDMFVAALLDALPDLRTRVMADLAAVLPAECGRPVLTEGTSRGIAVCRFSLVDAGPLQGADRGDVDELRRGRIREHSHHHLDGHHSHDHHHHDHGPHGDHDHHHGHDGAPVRFPELVRMIETASLSAGTAVHAIAILRRLAEAESRMHRVAVEQVHFHELADWDSLMDVVAAGSIAAALGNCSWSVSDLPKGRGRVRTQHGVLPVPAPATTEILRGFRWHDDGIAGERVTPTGAAIVAHLVGSERADAKVPTGVLQATGIGAGSRDLPDMPNILRALVFSTAPETSAADDVIVMEFDVDDMTGEEIAVAADRLRGIDGVIDLTIGMRSGKKGRPVSDFRLLLHPDARATAAAACFSETATIGLRWRTEPRMCLPRRSETVTVDGTKLHRKRVARPGGDTIKMESDDLRHFESLGVRRGLKARCEHEDET
jgi:uncharacterized protein (TIGR00299 family) protein